MMRRIFRFFWSAQPAAPAWTLSAEEFQQLMGLLSDVGLRIVSESRGPVPLLTFGRRVLDQLEPGRRFHTVDIAEFASALKAVIREMQDERLRVMSPSDFPGVGYVFNAADPETWPVKSKL
jgi:hypothetical protein